MELNFILAFMGFTQDWRKMGTTLRLSKLLYPVAMVLLTSVNYSCDTTPPSVHEGPKTGSGIDSTRVLKIVAFRDTLVAKANERQQARALNPSIFENENRFDYLTWDDGSAMYHGRFITDSSEVRVMFFLQNGKLVNTHYRAFFMRPVRLAKEALLYYDNNEALFFVEEHSMLLGEDELPVLLKNQPYIISQRPLKEWEEEVKPYKVKTFAVVKEALEKAK